MDRFDNWENSLCHHGIKGQKWGIRRYQNPDGTLTEEGKQRYKLGSAMKEYSDDQFKNKAELKKELKREDKEYTRLNGEKWSLNYDSELRDYRKKLKETDPRAARTFFERDWRGSVDMYDLHSKYFQKASEEGKRYLKSLIVGSVKFEDLSKESADHWVNITELLSLAKRKGWKVNPPFGYYAYD